MRICRSIAAAVFLALSSSAIAGPLAQDPAVDVQEGLTGRVTAADTGAPVEGAHVLIEDTAVDLITDITDSDGSFSLPRLPPGEYTLVIVGDGFEPVRQAIEVSAGASPSLDVLLPRALAVREEVTVVAPTVGELGLTGQTVTASRLGLRAVDIPASIDIIDSTVMQARGYQTVSEAVESLAGVVAGLHPTAPATFTMRGFTASQVTALRDGIWLGPSPMVNRPQNTFNLARVEVLRGPSSVIHGQGAVAGAINSVTKRAEPTATTSWNGLFSYGRYDTYDAAVGVNGPINDTLWYRVDVSRNGSSGYVDRMDPGSFNVTGSVLWQPTPRAQVRFSADYLDDDLGKYFGTPLVPTAAAAEPLDVIETTTGETIDGRTRFVNYNVSDGFAQSKQVLVRSDLSLALNDQITLTNTLYGFDADRRWQNAEGYPYCTEVVGVCTTVGEIQRYFGYFFINHDQQLFGDRLALELDHQIGGRENRGLVGVEASTLDFERARGFRRSVPPAPGDSVDLLDPVPGLYGPLELRGISPTTIDTWAFFAEDSMAVTDRLRISGGLRYDQLDLDRANLNAALEPESGGFVRTFTWWSWRTGAVVDLGRDVVAYGQYSNARDPISANIFLVNSSQNFDLTKAVQWEVGLKANLDDGRSQLTFAYFDIDRDDVLQRFALDSATNIGGIDSKGVELGATLQLSDRSKLGANLGRTDAVYKESANFDLFAGNRPPNVAAWTTNLWASYEDIANLPIEVGGSVRVLSDRFANNANTITMKGYALADVFASWTRDRYRLTFRLDNLTDTVYASWADVFYLGSTDPSFIYANQLMLGQPRTFTVMMQVGL